MSSGSESSIDISQLSALLANISQPSSSIVNGRFRARARGTGHRRRISQARASRSSVYDTIIEESSVLSASSSPARPSLSPTMEMSPAVCDSVVVIADGETESLSGEWDTDHGFSTLRQYYALKDEAHETVTESKRVWIDTPFSIFAVQCKCIRPCEYHKYLISTGCYQRSNRRRIEVACRHCWSIRKRTMDLSHLNCVPTVSDPARPPAPRLIPSLTSDIQCPPSSFCLILLLKTFSATNPPLTNLICLKALRCRMSFGRSRPTLASRNRLRRLLRWAR